MVVFAHIPQLLQQSHVRPGADHKMVSGFHHRTPKLVAHKARIRRNERVFRQSSQHFLQVPSLARIRGPATPIPGQPRSHMPKQRQPHLRAVRFLGDRLGRLPLLFSCLLASFSAAAVPFLPGFSLVLFPLLLPLGRIARLVRLRTRQLDTTPIPGNDDEPRDFPLAEQVLFHQHPQFARAGYLQFHMPFLQLFDESLVRLPRIGQPPQNLSGQFRGLLEAFFQSGAARPSPEQGHRDQHASRPFAASACFDLPKRLRGKKFVDRLLQGLVIDYNPRFQRPVLVRHSKILSERCGKRLPAACRFEPAASSTKVLVASRLIFTSLLSSVHGTEWHTGP